MIKRIFFLVFLICLMQTAKSDENKYPMCYDKTNWLDKNWCETMEFQKQGWQKSRVDLEKSKNNLKSLSANIINSVKAHSKSDHTYEVNNKSATVEPNKSVLTKSKTNTEKLFQEEMKKVMNQFSFEIATVMQKYLPLMLEDIVSDLEQNTKKQQTTSEDVAKEIVFN